MKVNAALQRAKTLIEGRIAMNERTAATHPDVFSRVTAKARVDAYRSAILDIEAAESAYEEGLVWSCAALIKCRIITHERIGAILIGDDLLSHEITKARVDAFRLALMDIEAAAKEPT